ncbi:hypothetical protein GF323_01835 [Candidatus Woesearchaeota archaeon]|nr:hypothetical protein [Candidatus Woesearchaeota archaeon]
MFRKRAQAAMEFLMTYGWAILVVLVAIGALAYFGVLSPERFLPERCDGPAGLTCLDKATVIAGDAATAGEAYLEIAMKNNLGYPILILDTTNATKYKATGTGDLGAPCEDGTPANTGEIEAETHQEGGTGTLAAVGAGGLAVPNNNFLRVRAYSSIDIDPGRFNGDLTIWYINTDTGLEHPATYAITGAASDVS